MDNSSPRATISHADDDIATMPASVGTLMVEMLGEDRTWAGDRYPILRRGNRKPLPPVIWRAIYARDYKRLCPLCGRDMRRTPPEHLHVDHIIPWSANGSDSTENLRLTHAECNEARGNLRRRNDAPELPISLRCMSCIGAPGEGVTDVWCYKCHRAGRAAAQWLLQHEGSGE